MIKNLHHYPIVREHNLSKTDLIDFEMKMINHWESSKIRGPVHLSNGNEDQLVEIFKRIKKTDWVFSTWRSHYHALLKGLAPDWIEKEILAGRSITICNIEERFYSSAIVGSTMPIALGVAKSLKIDAAPNKVWCFVGDMAFETGTFYETYKYAKNFDLPITFVVEDNGISTYTPTEHTWNRKREIPDDVVYYQYKSKYPHYGSGKWIAF